MRSFLLVPLLALPFLPAAVRQEAQDDVVYMGRAFLFEADPAQGRALGWAGPDESDEEILDAVEATLRARARSSGRFLEAQVAREEGARFSVTFVGPQAPPIEAFLKAGLSSPGRLACRLVAREQDLAALGTGLDVERERLRAWTAAHPEGGLAAFQLVPRAEGGPPPELLWLPGRDGDAEPTPLLRRPEHVLAWTELEPSSAGPSRVEGRFGLRLTPKEEERRSIAAFFAAHDGPTVVVVLDDFAVDRKASPPPAEGSWVVDLELGPEQIGPVLFAAAGEPLRAPLRFLGFDKRELQGVRRTPPGRDG